MTVIRKKGRPTTFSKKSDAAALFRELQRQGMPFRAAETVMEALLGVGKGELNRGRNVPLEPLNEESDRNIALYALAEHAGLIRSRLLDPETGAHGILEELPDEARAWLERLSDYQR